MQLCKERAISLQKAARCRRNTGVMRQVKTTVQSGSR